MVRENLSGCQANKLNYLQLKQSRADLNFVSGAQLCGLCLQDPAIYGGGRNVKEKKKLPGVGRTRSERRIELIGLALYLDVL